jgi:hypothetical protein
MSEAKTTAKPSSRAVPAKADEEAWAWLTREEQLAGYKELFNSPGATDFTDIIVAEIIGRSRAALKAKHGEGL